MRWLDFLFPPRVDEIAIRDVPVDAFLAFMILRLVQETRPEAVALLPFNEPCVRSAIHEAKYRGSGHAFELLGSALIEYLRDADDGFRKPIIVPVPLGVARREERGFNQVEEVARRAAQELKIRIDTGLLIRTRETASQVSLPRHERKQNMRGAFGVAHSVDPSHTYIVIDDVITTGATLQAAVDALRAAGAQDIIPLALAH